MMLFQSTLLLLFFELSNGGVYEYPSGKLPQNQLRMKFWDPPKNIHLNAVGSEDDYVVFFGSDTDRPLDYSCGSSCDIQLEQRSTGVRSVIVSASVNLVSPPPASTGVLQLCIGPQSMFWKKPLIEQSAIACIPWRSSHQRKSGYLIQPDRYVDEPGILQVHTWYMTEENYEHMREHSLTEVLVPLFDETYWLPIVTTFYHGGTTVKCYFKAPFHEERVSDEAKQSDYTLVYKYTNFVEAHEKNSGVYVVSCSGMKSDNFAPRTWPIEVSKSLNITFFKGPRVLVEGKTSHVVTLSPKNSFNISVYSTSPISTFEVERTDGLPTKGGGLTVSQAEVPSPFSIRYRYSVVLPAATEGMHGTYTVSVVNVDGEATTEILKAIKPRALKVVVSPTNVMVAGEGDKVSVECIAVGEVESIQWTRDSGLIKNHEALTEETIYGDHQGLKLVLPRVRLDDSGKYVCTARDQYMVQRASLSLAVWTAGSPLITDHHVHSLFTPHHHNTHTLNISEVELQLEWEGHEGRISTPSLIFAGATILVGVGILALCIVAGCYYTYQLLRSSSEGPNFSHVQATVSTVRSSKEEQWDIIRENSVQMDRVMSPLATQQECDSENSEQDERKTEEVGEPKDNQMKDEERRGEKSKRSDEDRSSKRDGVSKRDGERKRKKERDAKKRKEKEKRERSPEPDEERKKEHKRERSPKPDGKRRKHKERSPKQDEERRKEK